MNGQIESAIVIERRYRATAEALWALWTTREGFQSWWGPVGFRADVHRIEARHGGALHYDMVADTAEMLAAMKAMGETGTTACRGHFADYRPHERLVLTQTIDFLPGVQAYESHIAVDFIAQGDGWTRMIVTLSQMHDLQTTRMQEAGFTSQLSKLDLRFGWAG
jgi:uncharacterized protein YndB with AHSA1/START domain